MLLGIGRQSRNAINTGLLPRVLPRVLLQLPPHLQLCRPYQRRHLNLSQIIKNNREDDGCQSYVVRKRFPFPQELVYGVVSSVDQYESFIPFCERSFVTERDGEGEPSVAGLQVGFREFDEEFTCELKCKRPTVVRAKSMSHSLFRFLETEWTIEPLGENVCNVEMKLKYDFRSSLYNRVSSLFAGKVATVMTKSFEKRSYEVSRRKKEVGEQEGKIDT
ncbi:DEKNAAC102154 [Brettanomyces naardenensis]|uniref:DEKNAAC102154 n=1 Tax=Brettanomyces naardenensis TaxID=13370 RepID=A0A448YJY2_BRENA|nr:DEKNAAC102154 [Brettanomyces naardenensis]